MEGKAKIWPNVPELAQVTKIPSLPRVPHSGIGGATSEGNMTGVICCSFGAGHPRDDLALVGDLRFRSFFVGLEAA